MKKIIVTFFTNSSYFKRICTVWISSLAVVLIWFFFLQYAYFKKVTTELFEVKEDYRVCALVLRRVLHEKMKEDKSNLSIEQKKKVETETGYYGWPRQVSEKSIVSSDENSESFQVVNRDTDYLRTSSIEFAKYYHLEAEIAALFDYPVKEKVQERLVNKASDKPIIPKRLKRRIVGTSCRVRAARTTPLHKETDVAFSLPIDKSEFYFSSPFGPRKMRGRPWRFHYGVDMAAVKGVPVRAPAAGIVLESDFHNGMGNYIVIAHNRKYKTRYFHLHRRRVKVGQKVSRGDHIGDVGSTGSVARRKGRDPSHLHFEVYAFGRHIDPMSVLPG
ncbi:M23 family metallopeptidase [bacterium]|nr:M23 family metallopeptidase [bacterium]